jgi:mRNA-degrading endonuclease RelE of RelBE toxin-antitoxin system
MDVTAAASWYEARQQGLGVEFREAVIDVFDAFGGNPLLNSKKQPNRNIRWRRTERFPYRVVYEIIETENIVVVASVLHAAWHDRHWQRRIR